MAENRRLKIACLAIVAATFATMFLYAFCSLSWPKSGFGPPMLAADPSWLLLELWLLLKFGTMFSALHCASLWLASRHFRKRGELLCMLADACPLLAAPATMTMLFVFPSVARPMLAIVSILCAASLVLSLLRRRWLDGAATILINAACIAISCYWVLEWFAYFGD
jgi:hypothetical protein